MILLPLLKLVASKSLRYTFCMYYDLIIVAAAVEAAVAVAVAVASTVAHSASVTVPLYVTTLCTLVMRFM
jgi:hypothetical protein